MDRNTGTGSAVADYRQAGFSLLGLLFLVAGLGVGLAAVGTVWHTSVKRDKERELLFIGNEYRRAIESFWEVPLPAGTPRRLPRALNELISDARFPHTVRHLRRIYRDPMTGESSWGLVMEPDGGILGVHSLSHEEPAKKAGFETRNAAFEGKETYSEWVFSFKPSQKTEQNQDSGKDKSQPQPDKAQILENEESQTNRARQGARHSLLR